jgi:DMSO/TMAO reductase YedYZ molybdopterin-dependent catalytic subunit
MSATAKLPPGQYELTEFPRFGLRRYAHRFPTDLQITLAVTGDIAQPITVAAELDQLPFSEQIADFHCVTTWSRRALRWGGVRFVDFYTQIVQPQTRPEANVAFVVFRCQDEYATCLPLADLLDPSVLLASRLDGQPLPIEHGAPLRLVAPAHYGYKNPKHVCGIEFWRDRRHFHYSSAVLRMMDHPRGRVAREERGRWLPGWFLRRLYRPMVAPTVLQFRRALERHRGDQPGPE